MATEITLRQGESSPSDVVLYDTPTAAAPEPTVIYLCNVEPTPVLRNDNLQITLRNVSATNEIVLYDTDSATVADPYSITICVRSQGAQAITGLLAVTESQDTAAFAGSVTPAGATITGTIDVTESQDSAAFTGSVFASITGTLDATETQDAALFTAPASTSQSGVRGGRKRIVVEIDGRIHYVRSESEAILLIEARRDEIKAEVKAESPRVVKVIRGRPIAKKPKIRVVAGSPELKAYASSVSQGLRDELKLMIDRLIIEAMEREQDDEDVLLLH